MQKNQFNFQTLIGILFVVISSISFSIKAIIAKISYNELSDPITLIFLRMLFAFPFFLWIAFIQRKNILKGNFTKRDYLMIFLLGAIGYYLSTLFDFMGLQYISASLERLILYIYPTIVLLMNLVAFKQKIQKTEILSLIVTYIGIGLVFVNESILVDKNQTIGVTFIFLCALTYSLYLTGSESYIHRIGSTLFASLALCVSSIIVFIHFFSARNISVLSSLSDKMWFSGLLLGIFSTVIPVYLLAAGIKKIGSKKAAIVGTVGPISTIILSYWLLGESINSIEIIGSLFIIGGVIMLGKK